MAQQVMMEEEMPQDPAMQQAPPQEPMPQEAPQDGPIQPDPEASEQMEGELINEEGEMELGEAQQLQLDAYRDNATIVVFSEDSQAAILQQLQVGENPIDGVASTAFTVHRQLEESLKQTGEQMTEVTLVLGAAHLVTELVVLAEAAGLYTLDPGERAEAFRHAAMKYFETGLKTGSIDPVKLQQEIEPLMNQEQRAFGEGHAEQNKLLKTPPPSGFGRSTPQQAPPQQGGGILTGGM